MVHAEGNDPSNWGDTCLKFESKLERTNKGRSGKCFQTELTSLSQATHMSKNFKGEGDNVLAVRFVSHLVVVCRHERSELKWQVSQETVMLSRWGSSKRNDKVVANWPPSRMRKATFSPLERRNVGILRSVSVANLHHQRYWKLSNFNMHAVMFTELFRMLSETEERNIITRFVCCAVKSSNLILRYQNTQSHEEVKRVTGSPGRPLASYVNPRCDKVIMKHLER